MKPIKLVFVIAALCFVSNIKAQTVYVTKTGEKYHLEHCHYLKYSKRAVKLKSAIEAGYGRCSVCKPSKEKLKTNSKSAAPSKSSRKIYNTSVKKTSTTSTQCTGTTKSGNRCKRKTKSASGRCYQH